MRLSSAMFGALLLLAQSASEAASCYRHIYFQTKSTWRFEFANSYGNVDILDPSDCPHPNSRQGLSPPSSKSVGRTCRIFYCENYQNGWCETNRMFADAEIQYTQTGGRSKGIIAIGTLDRRVYQTIRYDNDRNFYGCPKFHPNGNTGRVIYDEPTADGDITLTD